MVRNKKTIIVLGGGFAGIKCVKKLESYFLNNSNIKIILISEDNFLLFTPMLPQVASGMIETKHIITSIRTICKKTIFYEGRIKNIDLYGKIITLWGSEKKRSISINYDFLVIALGSQTNFFGLNNVEKYAYTMKTLNDAITLRNRIIDMLEWAENETDPIIRKSLLRFVIVGGGFAGVETAGEIMDLLLDAQKYYPNIYRNDIDVIVLEALPTILPGFSKKLSKFAFEKMTKRGINIQLKTIVTDFDGIELVIKKLDGSKKESDSVIIRTNTLIWTAGMTLANTIKRSMLKTDRGKIIVDDFLEVFGFPGVFAVGDCALFLDPKTKRPYSSTAQLAEAQAKTAAKNLYALIRNKEKTRFVFKSKGQMAIIGKRIGIASFFGLNIAGFWAWVLWQSIYLAKIPKMDKRIRVFLDWTIDLFFNRDVSRIKVFENMTELEYKMLDEIDDVW